MSSQPLRTLAPEKFAARRALDIAPGKRELSSLKSPVERVPSIENRRILVVDDNRAIHEDFRKILVPRAATTSGTELAEKALFGETSEVRTEVQFEIDSAYQGEESLALVQRSVQMRRPYSMAFLDMRMPPGWDGVETARKLWEADPYLQIVICTAYSDYSWDQILTMLSAQDRLLILKKPFEPVEALQMAYSLSEKWRLRQESEFKLLTLEVMVAARTNELVQTNLALEADVAERKRAELALGDSERRFRFLSEMGDATRALSEPKEIMGKIASLLGAHLAASRCAYADVESDQDHFRVSHDYTVDCLSTAGEYRLSLFGTRPATELREGRTLVIHDVDLELADDSGAAAFHAIGIKALICCPLLKLGRLRAMMAVHQVKPRTWSPGEISLVQEVAERCWETIERVHAESALRQSEEEFRMLAEAMPQLVWIARPDGWHMYFNRKWLEFTGLSLEESLGHGLNQAFHPEDRKWAKISWQEATKTGQAYEVEFRLRNASGSYHWMLGRALPLRDVAGRITRWLGTCTDIDELKHTEEILVESEERYRLLVERSPDAMFVQSQGTIVFANPATLTLLGADRSELILGRNVVDIVHPHHRASLQQRTENLVTGTRTALAEAKLLRLDGSAVDVEIMGIGFTHNSKPAVLLIVHDLSDRKQLEAKFLRSQRAEAIGALANGIAHDLNNALAPILMATDLLQSECADTRHRHLLDMIRSGAQRGADMVRQVLTFARGADSDRGTVQVKHLLREMVDISGQTFPKTIQIETEIANDIWPLNGNPTQLHQVLLNLCVNARDAMPHGGTLTLSGENVLIDETNLRVSPEAKVGPYVVLTATDTGSGMSPEVRVRIFDPFFTTKSADKGTGLGLSTVHSIVKAHGGFITVTSTVGIGSEFKVWLPADPTASISPVKGSRASPPLGHGEMILVVDDEAAILNIASQTLQMCGYEVITAADGSQAVALCAQHQKKLRLMLTDMAMPIMDGPAAIRVVRAIAPHVRIITASGMDTQSGSIAAEQPGAYACLHKPYSADELLQKVHEVLNAPAS
jgi:PAS domain S-box-containing protein